MKKSFLFFGIASLTMFSACNKGNSDWRQGSVELSAPEIDQTAERAAMVHYSMTVTGTPRPEITEFGLIVTANPEAPFHGLRFPNEQTDDLVDYSFNLTDLEGGTWFYVRPYAVTHRDTILGEIASFFSGKYYTEGNGVYDIEGNFYETVIINGQEWMAENLRTRTFCNGDTLVVATSAAHFFEYNVHTTLYTLSFEFDASNDLEYGKYYAGRIAFDERNICPCGWKIPHYSDVVQMANFVGNNSYLGGKMKSTGTLESGSGRWQHPNALATNLSGLTMNPGGYFYLISAEDSYFIMPHGYGQFMITRNIPNLNNQLFPSSIFLQHNRGFLDIMGIGELQEYVNIRCIKN